MNTFTDEDLTILESLEFDPPCEHSTHERTGIIEPAFWIVHLVPVLGCGCPPLRPLTLWCKPCLARIALGAPTCNTCGSQVAGSVLRVEPLR